MRPRVKHQAGIPGWFVTYADLMSLMLCFFVLLQVFSELKKDDEYQRVVGGVRQAFGYAGGMGDFPVDGSNLGSLIELLDRSAGRQEVHDRIGPSPDEGLPGMHTRVTKVREGLQFTVGGAATFDHESAEVTPLMRAEVEKLATLIAGRKNRIVIRGHAANKYLSADSPWRDLNELSYARAREVMNILVESGIDERYCRIEAAGRWEPLSEHGSGVPSESADRRVDIILTEDVVDEVPPLRNQESSHAQAQ